MTAEAAGKHDGKSTAADRSASNGMDLSKRPSLKARVLRIAGMWLGFTGLYSMFAVCPVCGQQSCPVGIASAGTFGAVLTVLSQSWKGLAGRLLRRFRPAAKSDCGDCEGG